MATIPDPADLVPLRWRRWLYGVLIPAVPLAVAYGADESKLVLWLAVAFAVLGLGTAQVYARPTAPPETGDHDAR